MAFVAAAWQFMCPGEVWWLLWLWLGNVWMQGAGFGRNVARLWTRLRGWAFLDPDGIIGDGMAFVSFCAHLVVSGVAPCVCCAVAM